MSNSARNGKRTPTSAGPAPRTTASDGSGADGLLNRQGATAATPRRGRRLNLFQLLGLMATFAALAGVGGILAGGLVAPLALGANSVTKGATQVFEDLPDELQPEALSQATYIYASNGRTLLATYHWENRIVVPLDQISLNMQHAVIATEDKRFYEHGAVDLFGIPRALVNNAMDRDVQGASTLTQQYVKNVLIEKAHSVGDAEGVAEATASTYERKLREAKLAISLEQQMSKDEILQGYLNIAQFGTSVYGVETAARHYFNTTAAELNVIQAATIAGITQRPAAYDPVLHPDSAQRRRNIVLSLMYQQGYIDKAEYETARETPLEDTLDVQVSKQGCVAAKSAAFFCDYVTKVLMSDPTFGKTNEEREQLLYRGGLSITTTIDMKLQRKATKLLRSRIPADEANGIASAMSAVKPGTGEILVMAQNRKYDPSPTPKKYTTAVNYNTDQEHGGSQGFQPGSTFKPFTLTEWLKEGHTLNEHVNATRRAYTGNEFIAPCVPSLGTGVWNPQNSEGAGAGSMSALTATARSVNTGFAAMEVQLDLCKLADTALQVGFRPSLSDEQDEVSIVPSMTLGVQNTSPLAQAAAFATFDTGGTFCDPVAILSITDSHGKELEVPSANCRRVLPTDVANAVTYALQQVIGPSGGARGAALANGRPGAGKTGTAGTNVHTWFVGFTPQLSAAVWVGNPEINLVMRRMVVNGTYHSAVYGSTIAAPIWKTFMDDALAKEPKESFTPPDPAMLGRYTPPSSTCDSDEETATSTDDCTKSGDEKSTGSEPDKGKDKTKGSKGSEGSKGSKGASKGSESKGSNGSSKGNSKGSKGSSGNNSGKGSGGKRG